MKLAALALISVIAVILAGCNDSSQPDMRDLPMPDFDALFQTAYLQPYNDKDVDRWLESFAEDAVGMHNGLPPLVGRDAIRGFGEAVRDNFAVARLEATVDEVRRSGTWAYTRGTYKSNFVPKSAERGLPSGEQTGKFLLIWERQADGRWLIILDMGNANGPA